jgi:hypothetical protein
LVVAVRFCRPSIDYPPTAVGGISDFEGSGHISEILKPPLSKIRRNHERTDSRKDKCN